MTQSIKNTPVGVLSVSLDGELVCSFNRMVVRKKYRGSGLAKWLDEKRLEIASSLNAGIAVSVTIGNNRALALEAMGFCQKAQLRSGHGLTAPEKPLFLMSYDLQAQATKQLVS